VREMSIHIVMKRTVCS